MFDRDSRSVLRSLIGLFAFRSNPVSKVYQHCSRNHGILEVTWSTGCLRKNCKRHCCWGVNTRSISATCWIEHAPNGSLLSYITRPMEVYYRISPVLTRWWIKVLFSTTNMPFSCVCVFFCLVFFFNWQFFETFLRLHNAFKIQTQQIEAKKLTISL